MNTHSWTFPTPLPNKYYIYCNVITNEARHNVIHATHVLREIWHLGWKNISNKVDQMVEYCNWP
jgi:hypothetical protein